MVSRLKVEQCALRILKPRASNPRTHTKKQIGQIADSIRQFGFTNPALVDRNNRIIAGHGRVEAAKLLGFKTIPIIRLEGLSEEEIRAYVIADNRLAELAGWDNELLALELQGLSELELDFDVTLTGFEMAEIDVLIRDLGRPTEEAPDPADRRDEIDRSRPAISRHGDLWQIGRHRLLCGDATTPEAFELLLKAEKAEMVFIDPPYNVPIEGHVSGLGKTRHREFAMASGEMSEAQFTTFLERSFRNLAAQSAEGSIHFVCMDWRHLHELLVAGRAVYSELKNICVWVKSNGGMGSLYRSQHEMVAVFKKGRARHVNNVDLGRFGRHRSNVWTYGGMNTFSKDRDKELALHPTVKPVALIADAILDCSRRGGIVLDSFAGSGTTLLAAERAGRRGYGIELDAHYVDAAIGRMATHAGHEAILAQTGEPFHQVGVRRLAEAGVQT